MMAVGENPELAHTGHHLVTSVAPEAFSAAWNAVWALTAALSAWLGFQLSVRQAPRARHLP
jgi:dipeptide/tripeptide permease